jgi:hypothetical protein
MPTAPNLYALLVGINCYLPNKLPDGTFYLSLKGCVQDILKVEQYLLQELNLSGARLIKLTATVDATTQVSEPPEQWPTYRNIVAAFARLTEMAQPGDQIYIHYSGHGGRAPTLPQHRHLKSIDETLVPMDIGNSDAQYLRDIELAYLLKTMVDKGLLVTIVLDSCHAGSATRSREHPIEAVARGSSVIDTTARPARSLVASDEALAEAWQSLSASVTRSVEVGSGWLLEPQGYVLLAACRAHESAYEHAFDGQQKMGALTYWLLDSLRQLGSDVSYKTLHQRILARIHSQFAEQTPQLEGEGDRRAFGGGSSYVPPTFNVMKVDAANQRILLNAGQALGLERGTRFAIYPLGASDLTRPEQRLSVVEISEPGATDSWAIITESPGQRPIEQGDYAVLLKRVTGFQPYTVRLVQEASPSSGQELPAPFKEIKEVLDERGQGLLQLALDGEEADCIVSLTSQGEYIVCDSDCVVIPYLQPLLNVNDHDATTRLVERLLHLAMYRNVRELENGDPLSALSRQMVVELTGVQTDYVLRQKPQPRPFEPHGGKPTLQAGEWTFLRVRNDSAKALNITVLNLQPDWAIKQIYPAGAGLFESLDPHAEFILPLQAKLDHDYDEATEIIKVFATLGPTNFRCLELPSLCLTAPPETETRGESPGGTPDQLLSAMSNDGGEPRSMELPFAANDVWAAFQVELRIERRRSPSVAHAED